MKQTLLSAKEVAEMLSISEATVYVFANKKVLNPVYLPHTADSKAKKNNKNLIRFKLDEVEQLMKIWGIE